jgi:hypothetical protein
VSGVIGEWMRYEALGMQVAMGKQAAAHACSSCTRVL